jgi:hypothetical protein
MRIELRDKPEEKKEPVVKLYLKDNGMNEISLRAVTEDGMDFSIAYFDRREHELYVFEDDLADIGFHLNSTNK